MPVTIPVGGGTFTAVEGETYILSPDTTGSINFTGDASFNVEINDNQTGGIVDNQFVISFGTGTDPTVTYAAGVDASSHQITASGDSLTINVGDGTIVGQINANSVSDPAGFELTAGNNVSVIGSIDGPTAVGAVSDYTIGSNFSITDNLTGSSSATTTMSIGDGLDVTGRLTAAGAGDSVVTVGSNASVGNSIDLRGSGDRTATFGDGLTVTGNIDVRTSEVKDVTLGNNTTVSGDVNLSGGTALTTSVTFGAGDNLDVAGNVFGSAGVDNFTIGDDWDMGGFNLLQEDDQAYLGTQNAGSFFTVLSGSTGNDGLTVGAPVGQEAAFTAAAPAAGWIDNGNGTVSSTTGSGDFNFNSHYYQSWEAAGPVCFTAGTRIAVANGDTVNVENLRQGDMVMTVDHGLQPVKWIGAKTFGAAKLAACENIRPIRIAAGALVGGMPERDLLVSPQHRMLVRSKIARRMFDKDEVLVAAKYLVALDGIDVADDVHEVTYVHFLCDRHEIVFANGAALESLYAGPQALKSVSPEAVSEIMLIFPELADIDYRPLSARQIVNGRKGRRLAMRHQINNHSVFAELH